MKLITKAEYDALTPYQQGYVCYMQACLLGSEIPDCCPYGKGTQEAEEWGRGSFAGILEAQDEE